MPLLHLPGACLAPTRQVLPQRASSDPAVSVMALICVSIPVCGWMLPILAILCLGLPIVCKYARRRPGERGIEALLEGGLPSLYSVHLSYARLSLTACSHRSVVSALFCQMTQLKQGFRPKKTYCDLAYPACLRREHPLT